MIQSRAVNYAAKVLHGVLNFVVNPVLQFVLDDLEKHWAFYNFVVILHLLQPKQDTRVFICFVKYLPEDNEHNTIYDLLGN